MAITFIFTNNIGFPPQLGGNRKILKFLHFFWFSFPPRPVWHNGFKFFIFSIASEPPGALIFSTSIPLCMITSISHNPGPKIVPAQGDTFYNLVLTCFLEGVKRSKNIMTVSAKAILSLIFTVITRYQLQISKQMAKRRQQKQMDMMITASEDDYFMQACNTVAFK